MYVCRLFHRDQPFEQIDARILSVGSLSLGRDPSAADWALADEAGLLSRVHLTLSVDGEQLTLTDHSTNGTFLASGERVPREVPVPIGVRDVVRLGALALIVDTPNEGESSDATRFLPSATAVSIPTQWSDGPTALRERHHDVSLIEAFCDGAQIESSFLSGEDPEDLMRRLGKLYQQAILGVATLMADRAQFKGGQELDRTTISASDNNPFKWAPTRTLALSLLCAPRSGFLSGPDAVHASFEDIAHHLAGLAAGSNAALKFVAEHLSPKAIDAEAEQQGFSLRSRATVARDVHARRHEALRTADGQLVERAFSEAYRQAAPSKTGDE